MNELVEVLKDELDKIKKALTQTGSDYVATVNRVDSQTAYVQIAGSDIADTPVAKSINAQPGDVVRVRVANGKAWITGNDTAPPTDDRKVMQEIQAANDVISQKQIADDGRYSIIEQSVNEIVLEVGEVDTKASNAQTTADGRMKSDMSNRSSSITIGSGQIAFNSNSLVVNSSKFTLDANGNATFGGSLNAASGTFNGTLNAAGGTFSGNLNAAGGTFSGTLNAAGGTFSGNLNAAGGSFKGNLSVYHSGSHSYVNIGNSWNSPIYMESDNTSLSLASGYIQLDERSAGGQICYMTKDSIAFDDGASHSAYLDKLGVHTSSDIRLKEDIEKIDSEAVKHLPPVRFRYKNDDKIHYGFIAQDVQKVMPDAVSEDKNGYLSLNYQELIAPLYALVREQEDRINQLEARLKALEDKQ